VSHWAHASPPPLTPRNLAARRSSLAGDVNCHSLAISLRTRLYTLGGRSHGLFRPRSLLHVGYDRTVAGNFISSPHSSEAARDSRCTRTRHANGDSICNVDLLQYVYRLNARMIRSRCRPARGCADLLASLGDSDRGTDHFQISRNRL